MSVVCKLSTCIFRVGLSAGTGLGVSSALVSDTGNEALGGAEAPNNNNADAVAANQNDGNQDPANQEAPNNGQGNGEEEEEEEEEGEEVDATSEASNQNADNTELAVETEDHASTSTNHNETVPSKPKSSHGSLEPMEVERKSIGSVGKPSASSSAKPSADRQASASECDSQHATQPQPKDNVPVKSSGAQKSTFDIRVEVESDTDEDVEDMAESREVPAYDMPGFEQAELVEVEKIVWEGPMDMATDIHCSRQETCDKEASTGTNSKKHVPVSPKVEFQSRHGEGSSGSSGTFGTNDSQSEVCDTPEEGSRDRSAKRRKLDEADDEKLRRSSSPQGQQETCDSCSREEEGMKKGAGKSLFGRKKGLLKRSRSVCRGSQSCQRVSQACQAMSEDIRESTKNAQERENRKSDHAKSESMKSNSTDIDALTDAGGNGTPMDTSDSTEAAAEFSSDCCHGEPCSSHLDPDRSRSRRDMRNQATSTSDPVMEGDHIQVTNKATGACVLRKILGSKADLRQKKTMVPKVVIVGKHYRGNKCKQLPSRIAMSKTLNQDVCCSRSKIK